MGEQWRDGLEFSVACSNGRHPDGPWHQAAAIPDSRDWPERIAQRLRTRAWGCSCPARSELGHPSQVFLGGRLLVTTTGQGGGAPIVDAGTTHGENGRHYGVAVIRRRVASDGLRNLWVPNYEADPCTALVVGLADEAGQRLWRALLWRPRDLAASVRWAVHNVVAHPLLVLWPRVGERLHDRTAPRPDMWVTSSPGFAGSGFDSGLVTYDDGGPGAVYAATPLVPPDPPAGPEPTPSAPPAPEGKQRCRVCENPAAVAGPEGHTCALGRFFASLPEEQRFEKGPAEARAEAAAWREDGYEDVAAELEAQADRMELDRLWPNRAALDGHYRPTTLGAAMFNRADEGGEATSGVGVQVAMEQSLRTNMRVTKLPHEGDDPDHVYHAGRLADCPDDDCASWARMAKGGPVSDEELAVQQVAPRRISDRPQA